MTTLRTIFRNNFSLRRIVADWKAHQRRSGVAAFWYAVTIIVRVWLLYKFVQASTVFFQIQLIAALNMDSSLLQASHTAGIILALSSIPIVIMATRSRLAMVSLGVAGLIIMLITGGMIASPNWIRMLLVLCGLWLFSHDRIYNGLRPDGRISPAQQVPGAGNGTSEPDSDGFCHITNSYHEDWYASNPSGCNPFRDP